MNWSFSRIKKLIEITIFYRKTNFYNYLISIYIRLGDGIETL